MIVSGCQSTPNYLLKNETIPSIQEIPYQQLQEKFKNKDDFILYIGRPDCGDCIEFDPILQSYLKEHKGTYLYYLNVQSYRDASKKEDASKEEIEFFENMQETLDYKWTPCLQFISNGKKIDEYQYLDLDFYKIKDKKQQEEKRNEFKELFNDWMDSKFK